LDETKKVEEDLLNKYNQQKDICQCLRFDLEKFKQENLNNKNLISDLEKEKSILQYQNDHNNLIITQNITDKQQLELNFQAIKQDLQNDILRMRVNNDEILKTKDQTINLLSDRLEVQKRENDNKSIKIKELNDQTSSLLSELDKTKNTYELLNKFNSSQLNLFKINNYYLSFLIRDNLV
jgi:hypothetical protein